MTIEKYVNEFSEVLKLACNKLFTTQRTSKKALTHKSVPWWMDELTILRKRTNAQRRRYQGMRNNEELRERRKTQYFKGKAKYATTIKREKSRSWNEYCNMTTFTNPWNEVYKLAVGNRNSSTQVTMLQKPDGSLTADIEGPYISCWRPSPRKTMNMTSTTNKSERRYNNRLRWQTTGNLR